MPVFRDTIHTKTFRAMFRRMPPYTLHNLQASLEAEQQRVFAASQAGFAQRTQLGMGHAERMSSSPAIDGLSVRPEAETGSIVSSRA